MTPWIWHRREIVLDEDTYLTLSAIEEAIVSCGGCPPSEFPRIYGHPSIIFPLIEAVTGVNEKTGVGLREPGVVYWSSQLWIGRYDMDPNRVVVMTPNFDPVAAGRKLKITGGE